MKVGEADYRDGAKQRLGEASILLRQEQFAGSVYLAGRAVEGILRALIWKGDREYATGKKTLETGHDLRELLSLVTNLGILNNHPDRNSVHADVQKIGRLWWNNMRFLPDRKLYDHWYNIGEVRKGRNLKKASQEYYDACSGVIKRCEVICKAH